MRNVKLYLFKSRLNVGRRPLSEFSQSLSFTLIKCYRILELLLRGALLLILSCKFQVGHEV